MNLRKLSNKLFGFPSVEEETVTTSKVTPVEPWPEAPAPIEVPPVVEPEPSCFVKGLVKSMKETPENWTFVVDESPHNPFMMWHCNCSYKHASGQEIVLFVRNFKKDSLRFIRLTPSDSTITKCEEGLIADALIEYLETPRIQKETEKQAKKEASNRAYFENIGCPKN